MLDFIFIYIGFCYLLTASASIANPYAKKIINSIIMLLCPVFVVYLMYIVPNILSGGQIQQTIPWAPQLGINLSFKLDSLSWFFAMIVSGIGCFIFPYAFSSAEHDPKRNRLMSTMLAFMASMLGLLLSDNLLLMFIFWELTGLFSYLLIGHHSDRESARKHALQALLVTNFGGLTLLAGFLLIGRVTGTFEFSQILQSDRHITSSSFYPVILTLIIIGCATKSAQFPFHFWLPRAMVAPTPVSAYLHSATMVKAGIFLFLKFYPLLGETALWTKSLETIGSITVLIAAFQTLKQTDIKIILAYTTMGALGIMTILIGSGTDFTLLGCIIFILAHAIYKSASFMVAGNIERFTATRDLRHLGDLRKKIPATFYAAIFVLCNMIGIIPFVGHIAKETIWYSIFENTTTSFSTIIIAYIGLTTFVIAAFLVLMLPFFKRTPEHYKIERQIPIVMNIIPLSLAILGLFLGLGLPLSSGKWIPHIISLIDITAKHTQPIQLWHGFNVPLILSYSAIIIAIIYALYWQRIQPFLARIDQDNPFQANNIYNKILQSIYNFSKFQTKIIQNGKLRYYLSTFVVFTILLLAYPLLSAGKLVFPRAITSFAPQEVIICIGILACIGIVIIAKSRLAAVAALGGLGYAIAIIYMFYGAPDLSMTQILTDTLMVIVFVLVFYHLPKFQKSSSAWTKARDAIIAGCFGLMIFILDSTIADLPVFPLVSQFFAETSKDLAKGSNIVNTIVVDYRALDTLGEITVLALSAIGVYGLLKFSKREKENS